MNAVPSNHQPVPPWLRVAFFLIPAGILLVHIWYFRVYITDDAFISFRFLRNLLDGSGLTYNPPERVWGYTNFFWIILLVPFSLVFHSDLSAARFLGVVCSLATLVACMIGAGKIDRHRRFGPLVCGLLLAGTGAYAMQVMSGLETCLFTMGVVFAIVFQMIGLERASRPALRAGWFLLALATLTRPEALFLSGILFVHVLWHRSEYGLAAKQLIFDAVFFYGLPTLAVYVPLALYHGAWYPNSIDAKVGLSPEQFLRGLHYTGVFLTRYPIYALLILAALWQYRSGGTRVRMVLHFVLFFLLFNSIVGGDWMHGYRLYHTLIALACILSPAAWRTTTPLLRRVSAGPRAGLAQGLIITACIGVTVVPTFADVHVSQGRVRDYVYDGIVVGRWMKENLPGSTLLATNTGGTIAYYSWLEVVDMMGLNDLTIGRRKEIPKEWKGIEKGDGKYVLSRKPDYIQFWSSRGSATPVFLSDVEIYSEEEFWRWYDKVEYPITGDLKLTLWKRRKEIRPEAPSGRDMFDHRLGAQKAMERSRFRY